MGIGSVDAAINPRDNCGDQFSVCPWFRAAPHGQFPRSDHAPHARRFYAEELNYLSNTRRKPGVWRCYITAAYLTHITVNARGFSLRSFGCNRFNKGHALPRSGLNVIEGLVLALGCKSKCWDDCRILRHMEVFSCFPKFLQTVKGCRGVQVMNKMVVLI